MVHTGEQGKSAAQNTAVQRARGEVLVFTDSDTRFTPRFLYELTRPLTDPAVGAVDGHLIFVPPEYKDAMHMGPQSLYWKYELKLRHSESELGLLAVTSGACMAVRRELFKPLPSTVGEDCVVPLDVITAKRKVIHAQHALAYDIISEDLQTEFKARVRMTLRNWDGTWRYRHLLNPMLSPTYAFALWSHKVLRWLSPLFLGLGTVSALSLAAFSQIFGFVSAIFIAFYLVGAAGWLSARYDMPKIPFASTVLSFLMVNVSFLVGLLNYYRGKTIGAYTNKID